MKRGELAAYRAFAEAVRKAIQNPHGMTAAYFEIKKALEALERKVK